MSGPATELLVKIPIIENCMHLGSDEAKERSIRGQFFQTLEADVVILMDMDRKQSAASITCTTGDCVFTECSDNYRV